MPSKEDPEIYSIVSTIVTVVVFYPSGVREQLNCLLYQSILTVCFLKFLFSSGTQETGPRAPGRLTPFRSFFYLL